MIQEVAAVVETPRSRERKWARDPGSAAAAARRPAAVPLPRGLGPQDRAALQPPSTRWASVPESSAAGRGSRSGRLSGEPRAVTRRGRSRRGSGGASGEGGVGAIMSVSAQRVCLLFIYFFKKIGHESHHIDLPEERRKRVGSEGGRREVNLRIPFN